jgi:chemotaxis protein MotB
MFDKKKKASSEEEFPTSPAWLTTYADMMSLLMCFFILIMSFSTIELDKFKMAMGSLKGALGIMGTQKNLNPEQTWLFSYRHSLQSLITVSVMEHVEKLREMIEKEGMEDQMSFYLSDDELYIRIRDDLFFELGKADLSPKAHNILTFLARTVFLFADEIKVEGHTDNLPIHTERYPSNWELSFARALSVIKFFVDHEKVDPGKLNAAGYGEFRPLVPNDSPVNRAKNRRVVIKVRWKIDEFIQ